MPFRGLQRNHIEGDPLAWLIREIRRTVRQYRSGEREPVLEDLLDDLMALIYIVEHPT